MKRASLLSICLVFSAVSACRKGPEPKPTHVEPASAAATELHWDDIPSGAPYVPPQCYTKTQDAHGQVHNPCFTCHVDTPPPNYIRDGELQLSYAFAPAALKNRWTNLFVDRTAAVAAISDAQIDAYVQRDNYPGLLQQLAQVPPQWDRDHDGKWSGFVPDVAFHFDDEGFDRSPDGGYTGWRAYSFFPLPGGFWPTNGSFGDAMVRLPEAFRSDKNGKFWRESYIANLAVLESLIARRDVPIPELDESALDADLDNDGKLGKAKLVRYHWAPGGGGMTFAGLAKAPYQRQLAAGLFPEGTELMHSLRYLAVNGGKVQAAPRMKELRYMKKTRWLSFGTLENEASREGREKEDSPSKRRIMLGDAEHGISNAAGWRLQAFIEDAQGSLRPQTLEEHAFCIGCHSGVGVTEDSVFSFGRKLGGDQRRGGWFHVSQAGLVGIGEQKRADGQGEYSHYLAQNGAGDELRENAELSAKFFDAAGKLRPEMAAKLTSDISVLLLPTAERARVLNKAYRSIVLEQSYARGRDATVRPAQNVHRGFDNDEQTTGISVAVASRHLAPSRLSVR